MALQRLSSMMSGKNVEEYIRQNVVWAKLPEEVRIVLGNSQREYDKLVLEYSIKNQLRYKGNVVRYVKKSEEAYYDILLKYSESHLMLYPYHLSDIVVRELRMTPFNYYINIIMGLMNTERSYDSLPNFAAADTMRLLGIGRNQYIALMNANRCNRRLFRRNKPLRDLLPARPFSVRIDPWWLVCPGGILEVDIKVLSKDQKDLLDILLDEGPQLAGTLDSSNVQSLYNRGLIYLDVPIHDGDFIYVPTLEGFVMNRVTGDYFENLLYQIFVAIDEQSTVRELAETLDIDLQLVKNAVSVFCRLGFAKKRVTGLENMALHVTWASHMMLPALGTPLTTITTELADLSSSSLVSPVGPEDDEEHDANTPDLVLGVPKSNSTFAMPSLATPTSAGPTEGSRRIAFLFDSTLTAFLMMGNLSASLKNHAVTLFEVGKLSDEALESFISELENVNLFVEGEAQRYSEHAQTLLLTIRALRDGHELDLIRGESLLSLDHRSRVRFISKTYRFLVSMAPMNADAFPLLSPCVPHFGPPVAEACSPWFRLLLYGTVKRGPISMYIPKGTRIGELPPAFWKSKRVLLSTATHEPVIAYMDSCLTPLNDTLQTQAVLLQEYSEVVDDSEVVNVPFPFDKADEDVKGSFSRHPSIQRLRSKFFLDSTCGYVVLLKRRFASAPEKEKRLPGALPLTSTALVSKDPRKVSSYRKCLYADEKFSDFLVLDCVYGIPLFDEHLNRTICQRIRQSSLFESSNEATVLSFNEIITGQLRKVLEAHQLGESADVIVPGANESGWCSPTQIVLYDGDCFITNPEDEVRMRRRDCSPIFS